MGKGNKDDADPAGAAATAKGAKGDVVGAALGYWRDFWRHYDDPDLAALFDFEADHYERWDPDAEEHTHEQASLHATYRDLFERVLANHLETTFGATPEAFFAALDRDLESDDAARRGRARDFLDVVRKADDYEAFAAAMRAAVAHARWLEEPD